MSGCVQVEEEVRLQIEEWEKSHGKTFLMEGVPFVQYIEMQWATFKEQKEQEKQERVRTDSEAYVYVVHVVSIICELLYPHTVFSKWWGGGGGRASLLEKKFF